MFDRTQLKLADREMKFSKHSANFIEDLPQSQNIPNIFIQAAKEVIAGPTILFGGAHTLIRSGHQQYLIDMIEKGYINHVAMNGAAAFHDWEIAIFGNCCEPVETYLPDGRFGMWRENSSFNEIITNAPFDYGFSKALGYYLQTHNNSILGKCHRRGIPATVHVSIGQDVFQMLPNFYADEAARRSYQDFAIC